MKFFLSFLKYLLSNDSTIPISFLDFQMSLLIKPSPPYGISNEIIKPNGNCSFCFCSINQSLFFQEHERNGNKSDEMIPVTVKQFYPNHSDNIPWFLKDGWHRSTSDRAHKMHRFHSLKVRFYRAFCKPRVE